MKLVFIRFIIPVALLIIWSQCANIQSPTGGPKDKRPPGLISSIPKSNETNYKGTTILLTFDENVKLNSPREEIIISPSLGKDIQYEVKGNKVFLTPKTPWKDSTTYSILFREGIQDVTESNAPLNLKLAFSTGDYIDSLSISGNVIDHLDGTSKDKITVAIYAEDTFNIFEHVPSYFTKTNKQGIFHLDNIRQGRYKLYAFDDKNKNLKVESRAEMYGFIQSPITLNENIDTLVLGLIQLDARPLKISSIRNAGNVTRVRFSKNLNSYQLQSDNEIVNAFGDTQSEITIWNPADSARVRLNAVDSLDNSLDTAFYVKTTSIKPVIERFTWTTGSPSINPDNARFLTTLKFNKPLRDINLDSLYIHVDSVTRITFTKEELTYTPHLKEISISKDLNKKMFGADDNPILTLFAKPAFAVSMDGDSSKAQSSAILIYWPEENATLSLQASTTEKAYIIQLLDKSSRKVVAKSHNNPKLVARNIPPSEYQIRVIIDENQNGRWDPGNFLKGIEPEKVIYYVAPDGTKTFPVRANWEVGPLNFAF